jgi:hypothetical protein
LAAAQGDILVIQRSGLQLDQDIIGRRYFRRRCFFVAKLLRPAMRVYADCFQKGLQRATSVWLARYENRVKGKNLNEVSPTV